MGVRSHHRICRRKGLKEEDTVFKDEDFSERFLEMLKEDAENLKELCRNGMR